MSEENVIPPTLSGESEDSEREDPNANSDVEGKPSEEEQIRYLEGRRANGTNFIFLFGHSGVGKTAITASLIYYLSRQNRFGRLLPAGETEGQKVFERIRDVIGSNRFPDRTLVGSLTEIDTRFIPHNKSRDELRVTFLDMSGEDLRKVDLNSETAGRLPENLDIFFQVDRLSMTFILVTSQDRVAKDDALMNRFLNYIIQKNPVFENSRVLLLISKWDEFKGDVSPRDYISDQMGLTYAMIDRKTNAFRRFSLGLIQPVKNKLGEDEAYITTYASRPAEEVFLWVYETIKERSLKSWWERFMEKLEK